MENIINTIIKYRAENQLSKREFCKRFGLLEQNYNRELRDSGIFVVVETESIDLLYEVKGEYIK